MYRVGIANDPLDEDPSFETLQQALEHAAILDRRIAYPPIAVWDDDDDILVLVFGGEQFRRV